MIEIEHTAWSRPNDGKRFNRVSKQREPQDSLKLSSKQIDYLLTGDSGSYSDIESDIEAKVDNLGERFKRLVNDMAILGRAGFLTAKMADGEEAESTARSRVIDDFCGAELYASSVVKNTKMLTFPERKFLGASAGYELGLALGEVFGQASESEVGMNFMWGILLAQAAPESGQTEDEESDLLKIIEQFNKNLGMHREFDQFPTHTKELKGGLKPLRDALEEFGLTETDFLFNYLASRMKPHFVNYDLREYNIADARRAIRKQSGILKPEIINTVLCEDLSINAEQGGAPGIDGTDVFSELWTQTAPTSADIAKAIADGGSASKKDQVTQACHKLADKRKNPSSTVDRIYQQAPVVAWDDINGNWELTPYGTLLAYFDIEKDRSIAWLQRYVLTDELADESPDSIAMSEAELLDDGLAHVTDDRLDGDEDEALRRKPHRE
jgi:hypothetical protein